MLAIELDAVFKTYSTGPTVLNGVSFSVQAGEAFALIGANGTGKSTLMRILATLSEPSRGAARILGLDGAKDSVGVRRKIGFVGQGGSLDPKLSGFENLFFRARLRGLRRSEAKEAATIALASLGLEKKQASYPAARYSEGTRRRLDIACSLLGEPSVLLLDEPCLGLDARSRDEVWDAVEAARRVAGLAVLVATRSADEVERICRRGAYLERGRITAEGPPGALERTYGYRRQA